MKLLLKAALQSRRHLMLLIVTAISMIGFTIASQMEMFAAGVLLDSGPNFFQLFAPEKEGHLETVDAITRQDLDSRWQELAQGGDEVSKTQATAFLANHNQKNLVAAIVAKVNSHVDLSKDFRVLAVVLLFIALLKAITMFFHRYTTECVAIRVSADLRQRYFEHIQKLPMSFYQAHNSGALSARVAGDAVVVAQAINAALLNYLQLPFTVLSTLVMLVYISLKLSILVFIGIPLIILPIVLIASRIKKVARQIQRNQEGFAAVLLDFLSGIQTVKVFAMEAFSLKKYGEENRRMAHLEEKNARYSLLSRPILHAVATIILATVILYGLYIAQLSVSETLTFCGLLYLFYEPVKKFAEENNLILRGVTAAERMFEVLNITPDIQDSPDAIDLTFSEKIEFRNVSFRYNDEWILKDLSFTIRKGEIVAIVGPTGAGKSTIVQLLPRLYDVQQGAIYFDGKPLKAYTQRSLRESIAFVPQRPFLFLDTVAHNISFGRPFPQEEIVQAARRAHADEFIQNLPQKYDTLLAETGKTLSGGQQQRLAIARALVKRAPILVMDEATSSLDALSEQRIKMAIEELHGQITQILIAHRFSTIEEADRIIYIDKGEKIGEGTKEEMLATCPPFKAMWEVMYQQQRRDHAQ